MKCMSYCTAESYSLEKLTHVLDDAGLACNLYDNVVHLKWEENNWIHELFFFDYGCYVVWAQGAVSSHMLESIELWLKNIAKKSLESKVEDVIFYVYSDKTYIVEEEDTLFIENDTIIKLSMAHALSQSAKLAAFEQSIMDLIRSTRHLTDELAGRGKTSLSHQGLAQMIGQLFASRQSINLHTDILDTPEFFWRRPKYEPYYQSVSDFMDLSQRIEILNKRLDVIQELYQMLSDELRHEHSSRLEWIIIVLILFEFVLGLLTYFS